jgi:hypothetical protein
MEEKALEAYKSIRRNLGTFCKYNLFLLELLRPLRAACSGGSMQEIDAGCTQDNKFSGDPYTMEIGDPQEYCCICMENFDRPVATICRPVPHIFCMDCIEGVLGDTDDSRGSCPLCRQHIRYKDLRRAIIPSTLPEDNILVDLVQDGKFDFIFKSKLEALVRELHIIREKEPSAKSLVFSQFGSTLEWFQTELPKHGFKYE